MNVREFGERYREPLFWLVVILLFSAVFITGCKDGPNGPETERITKTIIPTDGGQTLSAATLYDDDTGDQLGVGETTLTRNKGITLPIRAEAEGFISATQSVSFTSSGNVEIALEADNPDEVTIDFEIRDSEADSLVAGNIIADGDSTVSEGEASGTITLPYSETSVELCSQPTYFQEGCESITPDQDQAMTLTIQRIPVDVAVNVVDETGSTVENPTIVVDDYTYANGETTHSFGARAGNRSVFVTATGYDSLETSVSADTDHELQAEIRDLPECSDGIDNNGNGVADENEPGCMDTDAMKNWDPDNGDDFVYEPEDDNESLIQSVTTYGGAPAHTFLVSGAEGHRDTTIVGAYASDLKTSIQHAVSIQLETEVKVSNDQSGESFELILTTGSSDSNLDTPNRSGVFEDNGHDGWMDVFFPNINRDYFKDGTAWKLDGEHGTKARGEPTTDGNDDVIFAVPERSGKFIFTWFYEPEEVEDSQKAKPSETQSGVSSKEFKDVTGRQ